MGATARATLEGGASLTFLLLLAPTCEPTPAPGPQDRLLDVEKRLLSSLPVGASQDENQDENPDLDPPVLLDHLCPHLPYQYLGTVKGLGQLLVIFPETKNINSVQSDLIPTSGL